MNADLVRLDRVAHRFERIGREPRRDKVDVAALVARIGDYFWHLALPLTCLVVGSFATADTRSHDAVVALVAALGLTGCDALQPLAAAAPSSISLPSAGDVADASPSKTDAAGETDAAATDAAALAASAQTSNPDSSSRRTMPAAAPA